MTRFGVDITSLLLALCLLEIAVAAPAPERYFGFDQSAMRVFRRGEGGVKTTSATGAQELGCPYGVISQPGEYYIRTQDQSTCTWLFLTAPNAVVELEIIHLDFPCAENSFVEFFDGVGLQLGVYPSEDGHELPLQERVNMVCNTGSRLLVSSQNVAMLSYQSPETGGAFKVLFKHKTIPAPCNIFASDSSGAFTLNNHGRERNCTFAGIYPSFINVLHMAVGRDTNEARLKCKKNSDVLQFLEGNSFEVDKMNMEQQICGRTGKSPSQPAEPSPSGPQQGMDGMPSPHLYPTKAQCTSGITVPLMCQISVVRLVSSGQYDNSVTFTYTRETNEKNECSVY